MLKTRALTQLVHVEQHVRTLTKRRHLLGGELWVAANQ
jgi:hypothetical protein